MSARRRAVCSARHERHCSTWHAWCVTEYRAARAADERAHDIAYGGTTTEDREHRGDLITFRTWLTSLRRTTQPDQPTTSPNTEGIAA